jgi:hypothetical protein
MGYERESVSGWWLVIWLVWVALFCLDLLGFGLIGALVDVSF